MEYDINICNMALSHCNTRPIMNMNEISFEADVISSWYKHSVEKVIADIPWKFARKMIRLVKVTDDLEIPGWENTYKLPSDFVKVMAIQTERSDEYTIPENYEIMGDLICSNVGGAYMTYICNSVEPGKYPVEFKTCVSLALAHNICGLITGSNSLANNILGLYAEELRKARFNNVVKEVKKATKDKRYPMSMNYP